MTCFSTIPVIAGAEMLSSERSDLREYAGVLFLTSSLLFSAAPVHN
jgi:hypothetical protein